MKIVLHKEMLSMLLEPNNGIAAYPRVTDSAKRGENCGDPSHTGHGIYAKLAQVTCTKGCGSL